MEKYRKRKLKMDELADVEQKRGSVTSCVRVLNKDVKKESFETEEK